MKNFQLEIKYVNFKETNQELEDCTVVLEHLCFPGLILTLNSHLFAYLQAIDDDNLKKQLKLTRLTQETKPTRGIFN